MSEEGLINVRRMFSAKESVSRMESRELLWWLLELIAPIRNGLDITSVEDVVISEIEDRLYPQYDGANVRREEWGWLVVDEDDVVYDHKKYIEWLNKGEDSNG